MVCGTMSNLFLRRGSLLDDAHARSLRCRRASCAAGCSSRRGVCACARSSAACAGRRSARAEEVFMTNAVAGIVSVAVIRHGSRRAGFEQMRDRAAAARAPGARVRRCGASCSCWRSRCCCSAAAGALVWSGVRSLDEPLKVAAPLRFKVPAGARFARVAADLASRGVVAQPRAWVLYARWKGLASAIKAGEYEIEPGTTPRALLDKLVSGQVAAAFVHHRRRLARAGSARGAAPQSRYRRHPARITGEPDGETGRPGHRCGG